MTRQEALAKLRMARFPVEHADKLVVLGAGGAAEVMHRAAWDDWDQAVAAWHRWHRNKQNERAEQCLT